MKKLLFSRNFLILAILVITTFFSSLQAITLYSYQSGNWDNADTWTTDPGGTTLIGSQVPASGDSVYILSSRTVTLISDVTATGLTIVINSGGVLSLSTYQFTNTVQALEGQGTLRLTSASFPLVTANTFVMPGGGTTEYCNFTGTLTQATYNNLKILKTDNTASSHTVTIGSNLTVHGDFHISRTQGTGTITARIGNNTTVRTISLSGNFTVSSGGILNTGNFNAIHNISLDGDLMNYGTIDLSNSSQYTAATNGAANFTFAGASDNILHCAGTTDFYRLFLDKGTDRTYVLTVTSTDAANFRLFGPVSGTSGDWSTLALVLQNGTLKLRSAVDIPALGEDTGSGDIREFHIPGTAGLWIDGAHVATSDDGGGWRGITVNGLLRVSAGTFTNRNNTGGITYSGNMAQPGYILIEGGTVYTTQVKQADVNGRVTYHQTGGSLRITGFSDSRNQSAVFALPAEDLVFNMSGGNIYIAGVNTTATNGIDIRVGASNYSVTGGTVTVVRPSNADDQTSFEIYSTVPFYNLTLKDTSASGSNLDYILQHDLTVLNDFILEERTLDADNNNLTVGGNFTLGSGAVYVPGNNTTGFIGGGNHTYTNEGTVISGFSNLVIDKPEGSLVFFRTIPNTLPVRGNFNLNAGTYNDGGHTINVSGNVNNSGIHEGTGLIILSGTGVQTIGGDGSGIFQNLSLNNTNGVAGSASVSLDANISVQGILTLQSERILNIGIHNLNLGTGASLSGSFSATRFIATTGDIGDKGITKTFSTNTFFFPIGVIPGGIRYTPMTFTLSTTPASYGSLTVYPVDAEQMQTSANGKQRSLTYFWREISSGFNLGTATVSQTFIYDQSDVSSENGATEEDYVPARYDPSTFTWSRGATDDLDHVNNVINWPDGAGYIDGDYTAGDDSPAPLNPFGSVQVFYSRQDGAWRNKNTWVIDTITNINSGNWPDRNTPAVIRNGHTVTADRNDNESGNLQIQATGVLNCNDRNNLYFGVVTNPVNGSGIIRISTNIFPKGDFSAFRGPEGGTVEYYGGPYIIPITSNSGDLLNCYRNLLLTPGTGQTITMPDVNMTLYGDITVQGAATGSVYLNSNASRTMNALGNVSVTSGTLQFRNGSAQEWTVNGGLSVSAGAAFSVQNAGTTANSLFIYGDITNNGTVNFNNSGSCDITFAGSDNTVLTGTGSTTLRNVTVNKGTSQSATITVDVSGITFSTPVNDWLTLQNGTFRFLRTGSLNLTTTSTLSIPATAGLYLDNASAVAYIGNSNSNDNDLFLDGKLTLMNGSIYVGPVAGPGYNNDIEYSASGFSEIEIQGGTLIVNGQIRRSASGTSNVLKYRQSDGSVTINGNNQLATRAKLEIENTGSEFTMSGGTLTLVRGGGTTYGDLYLRPASGSVTGGTIYFGTQNVGVQTLKLDANIELNNLNIEGTGAANTLEIMVNPLNLNGSLTISNANSYFTSNNINVSLKGDFINNGTYTPGTNTTTLNGTIQSIEGSTSTWFYDLVLNPFTSVTLDNNITVSNALTISSGTFSTLTYDVNARGNVVNHAVHTSDGGSGGILLNGTVLQLLSGAGTYGRLELDNSSGARLQNSISLSEDLLLTRGVLDINQHLLSLGINSDITGSGFGPEKMIKPDGVLSNVGIRKSFATGPASFNYPLGVTGKYTPAELSITENITAGSIRVNVINDRHPAVTDGNNVLQYYWEVESTGISDFEGNLQLHYSETDVLGPESDYVAARLIVPPGTDWSKAAPGSSTDNVNEALNVISFDFPAGTSNLGGEYTAGTDDAIPDEVPVYTSNSDGAWDDVNIWTPVAPAGGPNGFIVIIRAQDSVTTNGNRRFAYRTTINGTLDVGSTYGHNLGHLEGTGKLYLTGPVLPAGRFTSFLSCSGGILEYGGNTDYTIIADRIDTVRNLFFTGTGIRTLPDKDLVICDLLRIDGPVLNNEDFDRKITLFGGIERLNTGAFISGSGPGATISFKGYASQEIGGAAGNFTGSNAFNNLEIDNVYGLTLNGPLELNGNLLLTDGVITTTSTNLLEMLEWSSTVIPAAGSSGSYVSGPMSKSIFEGDDFDFPTGKDSRYGVTGLLDASQGTWEAEYFNTGHASSDVTLPLTAVSSTEYWHVEGPAGKQAYVKLRWDEQSDVTPLTTQNGISDLRIAEYNTGTSSWEAQSTLASGDDYDGTAQTLLKMDIDEHDYTLGSVSILKPRASFLSTEDACTGDDLFVMFTSTAGPYEFTYSVDGGPDQPVSTSSNPYTIIASVAGRYRLTGFTGGVVDTNSVMVYESPTASLSGSDADNAICSGESVTFTAGGGVNFNFYVNGISVQNGSSSTYITTSLTDGDIVCVVVTNASGCSDYSEDIIMTVHTRPVPVIDGNVIVCTGGIETYTTEMGRADYSWNIIGGTISAGGTSADNSITVTWETIGLQTVSVNYTNASGCRAIDDMELNVEVYKRPETGPSYYVPNDFIE
ncbi:MAG: hypothetical protein JXA61_01495 [Bacteroidales bacterium]|nr:hypothetical protein [Bacteroidales bacterium]